MIRVRRRTMMMPYNNNKIWRTIHSRLTHNYIDMYIDGIMYEDWLNDPLERK